MKTNLVVGDPFADGHGRSKVFTVEHSLTSSKDLLEAHKAGSYILGFNLQDFCKDYDDCEISLAFFIKLKEHGIVDDDFVNLYEDTVFLDPETYVNIWMGIAKLGNPHLSWVFFTPNSLDIGGYGLFH